MLVTNNLSIYKKVYKFLKMSTSLITNDLSVYVNDNGAARDDYLKKGTIGNYGASENL
jgi:hypothetical protein